MNPHTHNHPDFGTVSIDNGWVPAPGYVLRRSRVLRSLAPLPRGTLLDVGCGAGALIRDLQGLGFSCTGLEMGEAARAVARNICADQPQIQILETPGSDWAKRFDYVVSFEVLEHIEDHERALATWCGWLKPGGRILLSVPAGPERWNASDVWAGHYRRYTRDMLLALANQAGLAVDTLQTYGFPLGNVIEPIRALHHKQQLRQRRDAAGDKYLGSTQSGIERGLETRLFPLQSSWLGVRMMRLFCQLQDVFAETERGTGYFLIARRS